MVEWTKMNGYARASPTLCVGRCMLYALDMPRYSVFGGQGMQRKVRKHGFEHAASLSKFCPGDITV